MSSGSCRRLPTLAGVRHPALHRSFETGERKRLSFRANGGGLSPALGRWHGWSSQPEAKATIDDVLRQEAIGLWGVNVQSQTRSWRTRQNLLHTELMATWGTPYSLQVSAASPPSVLAPPSGVKIPRSARGACSKREIVSTSNSDWRILR